MHSRGGMLNIPSLIRIILPLRLVTRLFRLVVNLKRLHRIFILCWPVLGGLLFYVCHFFVFLMNSLENQNLNILVTNNSKWQHFLKIFKPLTFKKSKKLLQVTTQMFSSTCTPTAFHHSTDSLVNLIVSSSHPTKLHNHEILNGRSLNTQTTHFQCLQDVQAWMHKITRKGQDYQPH